MIETILSELERLSDEKTKQKYLKEGCDTKVYGVKIGDLKKLVKTFKINHNNELACQLMETHNYDAMYLAFLIMDPKDIDSKLFLEWINYSSYFRIRINSLAYAISEHIEFEEIIERVKAIDDDIHTSVYYAALAGKLIIDPSYETDLMISTAKKIVTIINSEKYQAYPLTRKEMNSFIGYVGMQIGEASELMIKCYNEYAQETDYEYQNQEKFILSCIKNNTVGKKRKKARC